MASDGIDRLQIDIVATADQAIESIDSLLASLGELNSVLGGFGKGASKNGTQSISDAFKSMASNATGISTKKLSDTDKILSGFDKEMSKIAKKTDSYFNLDGRLTNQFNDVGRAYRDAIVSNSNEAWNKAFEDSYYLLEDIKRFGKINTGEKYKLPYQDALEAARASQEKFYVEGAEYSDLFKQRMSKDVLGKFGSMFTADKAKATGSLIEWLERLDRASNGTALSGDLKQSLGSSADAFRVLTDEIAKYKQSYKDALKPASENDADAVFDAINGAIERTSASLREVQTQAQKYDDALKNIGKDVEASGNAVGLNKQIEALERRKASLLSRQQKADALGETDGKSYQRLKLDLAEVTNQLEVLSKKRDELKDAWGFSGAQNSIEGLKNSLKEAGLSAEQVKTAMKNAGVFLEKGMFWWDQAGTVKGTTNLQTITDALKENILAQKEYDNLVTETATKKPVDTNSSYKVAQTKEEVKELSDTLREYKSILSDIKSGKLPYDAEGVAYYQDKIAELNRILGLTKINGEELFKGIDDSANAFAERLKSIRAGIIPADTKDGLDKQIAKEMAKLDSLRAKKHNMWVSQGDSLNKDSAAYKNLAISIEQAEKNLDALLAKQHELKNEGDAPVSLGDKIKSAFGQLAQSVKHPKEALSALRDKGKETGSSILAAFKDVGKTFSGIGKAIGFARKYVSGFGKALTSMLSHIPIVSQIGESVLGVFKRMRGVGKRMIHMLGLMVLRRALYQVLAQAKEGISALAAYSNSIGTPFNNNISNMIASLRALSYQMAAVFEPIFNYIAPALDFLIGKLATAINYITQFFNALVGNTTWTKANASATNYGASVGGAGSAAKDAADAQKELNQQLMAWDKLNVITTPSDSGGGGNGGGGGGGGGSSAGAPTFSTEEIDGSVKDFVEKVKEAWKKSDFTEIGKILGRKLKQALDSIKWDKIQKTAKKIGKSIGTFIGGFISVPGLAKSIGNTIGQAINTVFNGLNAFLESVPWMKLGKFIADALNAAFSVEDENGQNIVDNFFTTLKNALNAAAELLFGFAENFDWKGLGEKIAKGIKNFLDEEDGWDAYLAGAALGKLVSGIATLVYEIVSDKENWVLLGKKIAAGINGAIDNVNWEKILGSVGAIVSGILTALRTAIANIKWKELVVKIGKGIAAAFKEMSVEDWVTLLAIGSGVVIVSAIKKALLGAIESAGGVSLGIISVALSGVKWVWKAAVFPILKKLGTSLLGFLKSALAAVFGVALTDIAIIAGVVTISIVIGFAMKKNSNKFNKEHSNREQSIDETASSGKSYKGAWFDMGEGLGKDMQKGINKGLLEEQKRSGKKTAEENKRQTIAEMNAAYGIHSPAKALIPVGKNILLGIVKGFKENFASLKDAVSKIPEKIKKWAGDTSSLVIEVGVSLVKKGWETVKKWVEKASNFGKKVKDVAVYLGSKAFGTVKKWIEKSKQWGGKLAEKIVHLGQKFGSVKEWIEKKANWGGMLAEKIVHLGQKWGTVKEWIEKKINWGGKLNEKDTHLGNPWGTVKEWIENGKRWGGKLQDMMVTLGKEWKTVASWVLQSMGGSVNKMIGLVSDGWKTVAEWVRDRIGGTVDIAINLVKGWGDSAKQKVLDWLGLASGGIYQNGKWHNIEGYANGGYPTSAQLFMAREAGPELVGTIGSHTAVMNNNQIVDSVSAGVAQAVGTYISPILREMSRQDRYLAEIASKEFGITSDDVFNATRSKAKEYSMRTGRQAYVF